MKNEKFEFVQRIKSHNVGDDCIQTMIPHYLNSGITILNSDGVTYHYKPNSWLFVNKYTSDKRKEQFPYSQIPYHKERIGFKIYEYFNQLLDFNRVYISIEDGIIEEYYVVKDGDEALLALKYILPNQEKSKYMTHEDVLELLKIANGGMFSLDAGCWQDYTIPTGERLLEWYKEEMRKSEQEFYQDYTREKQVPEDTLRCIDRMTIDDVPTDITIFNDAFLVSIENNEIKYVKSIIVKFMGANNYKVESYDFPITIYSLEHMKKLEQTNFIKTPEPKFSSFLNPQIDKNEIKKGKQLVLQRKK